MSSRSLIPGRHSRSSPASWRRTRSASSAKSSTRPVNRTCAGSFSTVRDGNAASMRERSPLAGGGASGFLASLLRGGLPAMRIAPWLTTAARAQAAACAPPTPPGAATPAAPSDALARALPPLPTAAMDAHLKYLADDLLEGRAPATRGGRLAATYIAAQFQALGLEPAGPGGAHVP